MRYDACVVVQLFVCDQTIFFKKRKAHNIVALYFTMRGEGMIALDFLVQNNPTSVPAIKKYACTVNLESTHEIK
jgi:hypothetical protein